MLKKAMAFLGALVIVGATVLATAEPAQAQYNGAQYRGGYRGGYTGRYFGGNYGRNWNYGGYRPYYGSYYTPYYGGFYMPYYGYGYYGNPYYGYYGYSPYGYPYISSVHPYYLGY